ncbi:hypothetical protein Poly21_52620 [Allorhodopirellula heiligendammensis]|uniref:Uncharacterized protein n=1 Tax=Allorhodopirellula heiligendammensis TaxID=2714739 RepID=A0A5C6BHN5_9BACT|nr:hypothetical protein Poly21_52620 [Allorhodopirellula heiligendammensis]
MMSPSSPPKPAPGTVKRGMDNRVAASDERPSALSFTQVTFDPLDFIHVVKTACVARRAVPAA